MIIDKNKKALSLKIVVKNMLMRQHKKPGCIALYSQSSWFNTHLLDKTLIQALQSPLLLRLHRE